MRKFILAAIGTLIFALPTFAQEGEEGHMHGPDGRHIVAPQSGGSEGSFILSHHDMRIEGPDGKSILKAEVDSVIHKKGDPDAVIHTEKNVYEPENEVYGSHMTYKEPGEYVLKQAVKLPDGRAINVEFPVYVPAVAGASAEEHAHGPNYILIGAAIMGGIVLLVAVYRMGQKNARLGGAAVSALIIGAMMALTAPSLAQEDEEGHMHGPDGRHIVAPDAGKASGPQLKAFPAPNQGESAEKVVDGIKFVLSIENEEMQPDPDLVSVGQSKAQLIGLQTAKVEASTVAGDLQATGTVSANPNGLVTVNARTSGRILSLGALPGTEVSKGQLLAVIESSELADAQAAYQRAFAEVKQAEAAMKISESGVSAAQTRVNIASQNFARQQKLASVGAFASPALEAARQSLSTAEARHNAARSNAHLLESRVRTLQEGVNSGVVARRELDVAKSELTTAQSELADAAKQLAIAQEAMRREDSIAKQGLRNAREVESAKADVDLAESALTSAKNVLVQARADLARARSMVRVAQDQVTMLGGAPGKGNRVSILAPISGEVEHREVSVGQTVSAGQMLYDLLNADIVWVLCDIYEMDVAKIQTGQKVEVYVDALKGAKYSGEVAFVHNEVDPSTRTTKVRIVVNNPGEKLKQNMFVRVQLGVTSGWQLLVPTVAIQKVGGTDVVFVEEAPNTYRKSIVRTAGVRGANTIIASGVMLGSKVVTDGSYQLASMAGN